MPPDALPVSVIIPTCDRPAPLSRTLASLGSQSAQPAEILIVDASRNSATQLVCQEQFPGLTATLRYQSARTKGAASQRNEGVQNCSRPVIGFIDDDILFQPACLA